MKVAVVDDNLWVRRGRAALLGAEPEYEVIDLSPREAMVLGATWATVDVVLVDAHDPAEPFDHFPGVQVIEAVRSHRLDSTVVVITGHMDNAFLRLRLCEAGANYLYSHEDVPDLAMLKLVVENPDPDRVVVRPTPAVLRRLGLEADCHPNAALHFVESEGLEDCFDGKRSQKALDLSRRSIMKVRHEIANLAGLTPSRAPGASRHLDAPEWRSVVDFVNRARGVERRNAGLDPDEFT